MIVMPQIALGSGDALGSGEHTFDEARQLVADGARALQLRDVTGAVASAPSHASWLGLLAAGLEVPVQFDGRVADSRAIEQVAQLGFDTVVVGMAALFDPMLLRWSLDMLGDRVVVELQVEGDYLFDPPPSGYAMEVAQALAQLQRVGVGHVLYREVGALELPLNRLRLLCRDFDVQLTYSGPVRSAADVHELASVVDSPRLQCVVIGAPLLRDGSFTLDEANRAAGG